MTVSAVLMIVAMMVHAPCTTVDMVFQSPFQTVLMMVAAVWKMVWMFCISACRSGVMVVMNVWMPVMIAVSAVMMMGPIVFQTFWRTVVMSVHPVCQICWIWLMVWVMNVAMVCRIGWHAVLIWFQIPMNHVAKLFQSRLPVSVWVKNHVSAATTAPMATTSMPIGFASKAALNANCTAVAALVTELHADWAALTILNELASCFRPPAALPTSDNLPIRSNAAVAVFSTPEAVAEMAFSPPETVFSPVETMSQPLTASNATAMAFRAPDTSAPFCCAHCPTDCSQPPTVMSAPVSVSRTAANRCAANPAVCPELSKPSACDAAETSAVATDASPVARFASACRKGWRAPVSMNVLTNVFAHPAALARDCAADASRFPSAETMPPNLEEASPPRFSLEVSETIAAARPDSCALRLVTDAMSIWIPGRFRTNVENEASFACAVGIACSNPFCNPAPTFSSVGFTAAVNESMSGMAWLNRPRRPLRTGVAAVSPSRLNAAFTLARAPANVVPALCAAPPNPSCMASAKVWKSILPSETMSDTSALVLFRCLPSIWRTGMPLDMSWSMSSPWSLPRAATEPKIMPMSVRLLPLICAVSATVLRTLVSWSPSLMPDADRLAATVAASPNPNAVPLTEASASFMISVTLALSWPRPLSLACAFSMLRARVKPPLAANAVMPPARVAIAPVPTLPILPNAPPIFEMRVLELFLEALLTASPMSPSMLLPNPLPDGLTWTYATPMSCAAIVFPYS